MPSQKRKFGDTGEREAENFLTARGYRIVDRNYRIKNIGEIDLIGEKNGKLTFFEVKTRNSAYENRFPIQSSINAKKRRNLKRICELYLINKAGNANTNWQVDGVFINVDRGIEDKYRTEHFENILWEEYY